MLGVSAHHPPSEYPVYEWFLWKRPSYRSFGFQHKKLESVFLMDAPREDVYQGKLKESNILWLHDLLRNACVHNQVHFLDLTEHFAEHYNRYKQKFNFKYDGHWNEIGHKQAAEALMKYLNESGILNTIEEENY